MTRPQADEHPNCKNESGMFKVSIPNWGDWEYQLEAAMLQMRESAVLAYERMLADDT